MKMKNLNVQSLTGKSRCQSDPDGPENCQNLQSEIQQTQFSLTLIFLGEISRETFLQENISLCIK